MPGLLNSSIQEAHSFLVAAGASIETFPCGTVVYRRGERLNNVYFILSGRVNLQVTTENGTVFLFKQMDEGSFFGELAILRKEPSSADAFIVEETSVLCCPSELIYKGIEESPALRALLIANLTNSVSETRQEVWNFYQNADAFELFLYPDKKSGPIIAKSPSAKNLIDSINRLVATHEPLFLYGERGSGKFFFANQIHGLWSQRLEEVAGRRQAPFVSFDFSKFGDYSLDSLLRNLSKYGLKLAELNLDEHILKPTESGTLILRRIDSLNRASQEMVLKLVQLIEESNLVAGPKIRLITTATHDIRNLVKEGRFLKPLCDILTWHVISPPPLRERKADILPLAQHFLAQADPKRTAGFSPSAELRLVNLTLRRENVAGLRRTVEFAVLLSDGEEIGADQIVNDPDEESHLFQFDVGTSPWFQWVSSPPKLSFIRNFVVISFLLYILMLLPMVNNSTAQSLNHAFWWFFHPVMFFLFFFMGRFFCGICPIASVAELIQRNFGLFLPPPEPLKTWGIYLSVILFICIITAEHIFQMPFAPLATAGLFIALIATASFLGFLYERRAWCRYLCPLGTLAASFGVGSTLHIRADSSICAEVCKNHVCVKGVNGNDGCPVFQHPLHASSNNLCVQCFRCMNNCPHKSSRYLAHPPLQNIWGMGSVTQILAPFCFFLFMYSPIILWMETHHSVASQNGILLVLTLGALMVSMAFHRLLNRLFGEELENDNSYIARTGYSLVLMAWGSLMAYILMRVPIFTDLYIGTFEGSFVSKNFFTAHTPLYMPFQLFFVLAGAVLALFTFMQTSGRLERQGGNSGSRVVIVSILAHALACMAIILTC
jgi:transcriptional regulator with AAA-type ATPase domain/ferredoxin